MKVPREGDSSGKKEPNHQYNWEHFPIGDTRAFAHRYRQSVRKSLDGFVNSRGLDWKFRLVTDPPAPKPNQRCNMIWVTRIEPEAKPEPNGVTIGEAGAVNGFDCAKMGGEVFEPPNRGRRFPGRRLQPVFIDIKDVPIAERLRVFIKWEGRHRMSQKGWERFGVGDYQITDNRLTDLLYWIKKALLIRNLVWRFEIRRVQNPNDASDRTPFYLVTRVR